MLKRIHLITLIVSLILLLTSMATLATATTDKTKQTPQKKAKAPVTKIKPSASITGNPIVNRDNFTINSDKARDIGVECVFINTTNKPVTLNIWTSPSVKKPHEVVRLKAGSPAKPHQARRRFYYKLKNNWWCRIYTPHNQDKKWSYCAYFSIADANIIENNPFSTWDNKKQPKGTSYHCRLKKPNHSTGFFRYHPQPKPKMDPQSNSSSIFPLKLKKHKKAKHHPKKRAHKRKA